MDNPRLTKLDQIRLIEERDMYRQLLQELQAQYDDLQSRYDELLCTLPNLDGVWIASAE